MDIKQSFLISIAKVKLSLYEQRILLKVMEFGQARLQGVFLSQNLKKLDHDLDNVKIMVPTAQVLVDGSQHYEYVYDAARSLCKRTFELWDSDKRTFFVTPLIYNVKVAEGSGMFTFYVSKVLFDIMYDFSQGFCAYDLATALSLPSPYAVRFYILLNGQHRPIQRDITWLKDLFGVSDMYKQTADFIKKVVEPSKVALDRAGCNSFTYERIKKGNKVIALRFFPVTVATSVDEQLKLVPGSDKIKMKAIQLILIHDGGFSWREINAHTGLITRMSEHPFGVEMTRDIVHRAKKNNKAAGWVINALKSEIAKPTMLK